MCLPFSMQEIAERTVVSCSKSCFIEMVTGEKKNVIEIHKTLKFWRFDIVFSVQKNRKNTQMHSLFLSLTPFLILFNNLNFKRYVIIYKSGGLKILKRIYRRKKRNRRENNIIHLNKCLFWTTVSNFKYDKCRVCRIELVLVCSGSTSSVWLIQSIYN